MVGGDFPPCIFIIWGSLNSLRLPLASEPLNLVLWKHSLTHTLNKQFEARLPARKFRGYKCIGPAAMAAMGEKVTEKDDSAIVTESEVAGKR